MNDMLKDELYHKWDTSKKADYNHDYYRKHKEWWKTKYLTEQLGDNKTLIKNAEHKLADAKRRMNRAEELRKESFAKADKNGKMANKAKEAGIAGAASELYKTANDQKAMGVDYYRQREDIKKKQVDPLEGAVANLKAERDLHESGKVKQAPSARVDKSVSDHDRGKYKYVDDKFDKAVSKTEDLKRKLDWKTAPAKNKAKRKAKDFVSNWKSGAQGMKSAAKSAISKAGKSFLDNWKFGAKSIRDSKIPGIENVSRKRGKGNTIEKQTSAVTVGDVMESMKGSKRTLSGQPKGFVENWKSGAHDIVNAVTKKKRKRR